MKDVTKIKITAIVCLTIIWIVNSLTWKLDSALLTLTITFISGICGYEIGKKQGKIKNAKRTVEKMLLCK